MSAKPTGLHGYLPSRQGQLYTWAVVYEPRDWWIGIYRDPDDRKRLNLSRIFVCFVPCFPIIVSRLKRPGPPYPTVGQYGETVA